jgi:hypothetical protein
VTTKVGAGFQEPHEPCRAEPSNTEYRQDTRQEAPSHFFQLVRNLQNILNEVIPSPYLPIDIAEPGHDGQPELRVSRELSKMSSIASDLVSALSTGKLRPPNQERPIDRDCDHELEVRVVDSGHGFPIEGVSNLGGGSSKHGVGMASMKERVRHVGGTFQVESDDKGTMISARIPIPDGHM